MTCFNLFSAPHDRREAINTICDGGIAACGHEAPGVIIGSKRGIVSLIALSILLTLAAIRADGHEPDDCSSRLTVGTNVLQVEVTMGMDGVRQILPAAGFSKQQMAEIIRLRPAREPMDLPIAFAGRLFELNSGGKKLEAKAVTASSDGLEVVFTLSYPRPATGALNLNATYFDSANILRPGWLMADFEARDHLGAALLSRTNLATQIILPVPRRDGESGSLAATNQPASFPGRSGGG